MKIRISFAAAALAGLFLAGAALPQDPVQQDDVQNYSQDPSQDPPSRVARLNWIGGNVSFQPAGIDTWTAATLNYPLTTGDHIYTDTAARAEMHVGPNAIRLNGQSNFGFLNLDDRTVQIRFTEGALEIRLRSLDDDDIYEVDTPQAAVSLIRTGDYRIDTDPARNATMITVFSGEVDATANGRSFIVHARQTAYISEGLDPDIRSANTPDDFDEFTRDRNAREDRIPPPLHVSEAMVGYQDLQEYGSWSQNPDYGWVWAPRVAAGWAPYREGRWAWVEPWGWTWIDEAPWGFAPFHYGRWAYVGGGWVWAPGSVVGRRPIYAPALVAFVGGPRFTLTLGIGAGGAIGWFPLGPREPFYPAYRVSNTYVRQVNITHVTNINVTNVNYSNIRYANRQVPGAIVAMPRQAFVSARPVREFGQQRIDARQLTDAQVIGAAPRIAPQRESVIGVQTNRRIAAPPQAIMTRPVVAKVAAPPPAVSFEARQQMIERNQGRPLAPDQLNQLRRQPGAVMNRPVVRNIGPMPAVPNTIQPAAPAPARQQPVEPRPADRPFTRQPDRMDTRPPVVSPAPRQEIQRPPEPQRQEPPRQERQRPENVRPQPEQRPAPAATPRPENRPQPEVRREPAPIVREPRAEPAPRREERPAPAREQRQEQRQEQKKEDKKDK